MKICILAAGKGTRMGKYGEKINKSLLPIRNKAIISHIIDSFQNSDEFVIALGYLGHQVKEYLSMAHPDRKFQTRILTGVRVRTQRLKSLCSDNRILILIENSKNGY